VLSVLIPARNEIYLAKTVESILSAARGEIEIIAVLDGYTPDPMPPDDPRVILIKKEKSIGQRPGVNEAAKIAKGKYILKTDAHSMFDEGFDLKLAADCEYDWTVLPRMYNLDAENWKPKTHKLTDFMWISSPTPTNGEKPFRALYWDAPKARAYPEEYQVYKKNPMFQGDICDVMTGQGACWFMHKDRFWELGGMDEAHGDWGQVGVEVALKAWLSGGRHVVNKKTWFAHWFRGGGGPGFPYHADGKAHERARKYSREFWTAGKWEKQVRSLEWLVEKFSPLPTWNGVGHKTTVSVPANVTKEPEIKETVTDDLTILYYTANVCEYRIPIENRLKKHGKVIVSISQKPIGLGINICVGEIGKSLQNIYRQVLEGAKRATTKYVVLCEDDCLYVPEHFDYRPTGNCFAYNLNRWLLHTQSKVFSYRKRPVLSQCIAPRELLIECLEKRFTLPEIPKKYCGEMGLFEKKLGLPEYPYETFETKNPNVVLCHDKDTSGIKYYGKDAPWETELPYWGNGGNLLYLLCLEKGTTVAAETDVIKFGRSGKLHSQHSFIGSAIFDVEELCKNRMDYVDKRKPGQLKRFLEVFPPYLKEIATGKEFTNEELEKLPYYDYMIDHLNPADRVPIITDKGKKHVIKQLRDVINLYTDIKNNGLKAPLDFWREGKTDLVLHRGGRRLEILKLLGYKSVPARVFKSKAVFRIFCPDRSWKKGPIDPNSIHELAVRQFVKLAHRATDKYWVHGYTKQYDTNIGHYRNLPVKLLEIGVHRGASLLLWHEAFPKAQIFGLDKNPDIWKPYLSDKDRIKVFVGWQEDEEFLNSQVEPAGPFDIIIDDGGHKPEQQVATFKRLWPLLNEHGMYVIEDLHGNYWAKRAPKGPLMIQKMQEMLADMYGVNNLPEVRSMVGYYNICFIEKV